MWWLKQGQEARDSLHGGFEPDLPVLRFEEFIGLWEPEKIWSHASFDAAIWNNFTKKVLGRESSIAFWRHADLRTFEYLTGEPRKPKPVGAHNALVDCEYWMEYMVRAFNNK